MKLNKLIALLLALVMVFGLVACGAKEEAAAPAATEAAKEEAPAAKEEATAAEGEQDLYTIDILVDVAAPYMDSSLDSVVGQEIAKQTGIAFNYLSYPSAMQEYEAMLLAGENYNEIQHMNYGNMVQQYIDAGALINLDDYKDLMPNFYERFAEAIPYWRTTAPDGGLYYWDSGVPLAAEALLPHYDMMVRTDVLEYYGWPELVTASDWIAFLEQAVKDFPTTNGQPTIGLTYPMAESYGVREITGIGFQKGEKYINCGGNYYTYNVLDQQFEDYLLTDGTKESIQFFNELYNKGLLDEECFTDKGDNTKQKMSTARPICVWYTSFWNKAANTALTEAGMEDMSYIQLPFQLDSQEGQGYNAVSYWTHSYSAYGITKNCKDIERVVKFIDWCCTEEAQILMQSGIEGVHYTVDENGQRVPTDLRIECCQNEDVARREGLRTKDGFCFRGLPMDLGLSENGQPYNIINEQQYLDEFNQNDRQKEAFEAMGWRNSNQWWEDNFIKVDPGFYQNCDVPTNSDLGKVGEKMSEVRIKYTPQLIMASDFEAVWNELLEEYNKLDHEAVIAEMNKILADSVAKMNG